MGITVRQRIMDLQAVKILMFSGEGNSMHPLLRIIKKQHKPIIGVPLLVVLLILKLIKIGLINQKFFFEYKHVEDYTLGG